MRTIQSEEFGKVIIRQVPLPEGILPQPGGIYTYSGRVAVPFCVPGEEKERMHIATVQDDGTGWHEIFDGTVSLTKEGNGFRFMPFQNNTRALIGDYVLECEPDLDTADPAKSRMVPIHYPDEIRAMPNLWKVWSEIIIAPDNEHMAWNGLGAAAGVYVAKLRRTETEYVLDHVRTISVTTSQPDPEHPGCTVMGPVRGGEIKQFLRGGLSVSLIGSDRGTGNSVVQALDSEAVEYVTRSPGYDETTIFSPDEKLGIVMTMRFSPKTNSAYIGLIPRRGNMTTKSNVINQVYMYGVSGVRMGRAGNIGPALVHIDRSKEEDEYLGLNLSDPSEEWVYYSPMSWHPSSKKVMWNEGQKKSIGDGIRYMIAELPDYVPGETAPVASVPDRIPYAIDGVDLKGGMMNQTSPEIKIAGKHSGVASSTVKAGMPTVAETVYENFSDDGESFLDGFERVITPGIIAPGDTIYDAKLKVKGAHSGEADFHVVYNMPRDFSMTTLGQDSAGFAEYDGKRVEIKDFFDGK